MEEAKTIHLKHHIWELDFHIISGNRGTLANGSKATIEEFNENIIRLSWDKYGKESFYRDSIEGQNTYFFANLKKSLVLDSKELIIHPYEGKESILSYLPYQKILISFKKWDFFYYQDCIFDEIKKMIKNLDCLERILFFAGCKEGVFATYLADRIQRELPDLRVGVLCAPTPHDFSGDATFLCKQLYSLALLEYRKSKIFCELQKKTGDIKKVLDDSLSPPRMFDVHAINKNWPYDKESADRISKYLYKRTEFQRDDKFSSPLVHRFAFSKFKEEDFALSTIKECFYILKDEQL